MKWTSPRSLTVGVLLIAALVGCSSFFTSSGDANRRGTGFEDGGGTFAPSGEGGVLPPPIPVDEEGSSTESFFAARRVDPDSEDTAGPKFVVAGDLDNDGLLDLASAWNQSQPVQVHLQRRDAMGNIRFETVQLAGTTPIAIVADIRLADADGDGNLDVFVLVKHRGFQAICPGNGEAIEGGFTGEVIILFNPGPEGIGTGDNWEQIQLINFTGQDVDVAAAYQAGLPAPGNERPMDFPELGGMTAMDVGDVTGDELPDVVFTHNVPIPPCHDGICRVLLLVNPGGSARDPMGWSPLGRPITLEGDAPPLKDLLLHDVDSDGDLDVILTRPDSASRNLHWRRNPLVEQGPGAAIESLDFMEDGELWALNWETRPIGHVDNGADTFALGDIDRDGFDDVVVRSTVGQVVLWFQRPTGQLGIDGPVPNRADIPWPVYTVIDLVKRDPRGLAVGDINYDGQPEVMVGAAGSVFWLDSTTAPTVFDPWTDNFIVDERTPVSDDTLDPTEEVDQSTIINALLVVDLDGDGANDIVGTIDRREMSGLSDDALVWYRNILKAEDVGR